MTRPTIICLDFDGTIMRYDDPPEHFHPAVISALNHLTAHGIEWIANSGRSVEGQLDIIRHCMDARGLEHGPIAVISNESYIHVRDGDAYIPWTEWNEQAATWAKAVNAELQTRKEALGGLIERHAPVAVYYREDGTVFQIAGSDENRALFIRDLQEILDTVSGAELINNGEWVAVIHERLGKGHVLRAWMISHKTDPEIVLAVGDHGNDVSMLDGTVTRYVACPGSAFPAVCEVVRRAGGYVARAHGPHGTVEAFQHFFGYVTPWPEIKTEECEKAGYED